MPLFQFRKNIGSDLQSNGITNIFRNFFKYQIWNKAPSLFSLPNSSISLFTNFANPEPKQLLSIWQTNQKNL